jgi:DNA-binding MarR family transcriptional regulator
MGKKREKISVCFYDFMKALGIRGTALTIYAFIYSYRKSEAGFFFGKRQFIADKCGISLRSVDRGIPKLLEMGLIERYECGKHKGFAVNEAYLPDKRAEFVSEKKRAEEEKRESYVHSICDDEPAYKTNIVPKYEMISSARGYFSLTVEQFEALLKLVPEEELTSYTARMDLMLEKNIESGNRPPNNCYRTLKKWILNDCKL